MEKFKLEDDIKVLCIRAESFPHDIAGAFHKLVELVRKPEVRVFFGISYQKEDGSIIYKAAVQQENDYEAEELGCETDVIRKGTYITETIRNWREDVSSIGSTFKRMTDRYADITFPCIEWYKGNDVMCMIRLISEKVEKVK